MVKKIALASLMACFFGIEVFAQSNEGSVSGNIQVDIQSSKENKSIGASEAPELLLMNGFGNIQYNWQNFRAGIRYEYYYPPMLGFQPEYEGGGLTYKYVQFKNDNIDVTFGNFYDQFGSGMIYRTYEERNLGYDNAMEGIRVKYKIQDGVYLKGLIGKQRLFYDLGPGIVRGLDGEFSLNDIFSPLEESKMRINLGFSAVGKYQKDNGTTVIGLDTLAILPENVAAISARLAINYGKFAFDAEYVEKSQDPSTANNLIYKRGTGILMNASYTQKGFGAVLSAKHIDNMDFRSDRTESIQNLNINYLPALTRQHAWALATLYPAATIPNGEMGMQVDLNYKVSKSSDFLGGAFAGAYISMGYSNVYNIHKDYIGGRGTEGYKTDYFKVGTDSLGNKDKFFEEFVFEMSKKINKKLKMTGSYIYTFYNNDIQQGTKSKESHIFSNTAILEAKYRLPNRKSIRGELQHLWTQQDQKNWVMGLVEYTIPHYFVAVQSLYNYGNEKELNYPSLSAGYTKGTTKIQGTYGKQRAGLFCVGGVCREVPAMDGFTVTITTSF